MEGLMKPRTLAFATAIAGLVVAALVAGTVLMRHEGGTSSYLFPLAILIGPWIVPLGLVAVTKLGRPIAIGALLMLAYELLLAYAVIINPQQSTAGMDYLAKPLVQLLLLMPVGAGIGWLLDKRASSRMQDTSSLGSSRNAQ
jgi:hypothetical protein